jgi:hypothetical protein
LLALSGVPQTPGLRLGEETFPSRAFFGCPTSWFEEVG